MENKKVIAIAAGAVVLTVSVLLVRYGFLHTEKPEADISQGRIYLAEMAEKDVGAIQAEIQAQIDAKAEAARAMQEAEAAALAEEQQAQQMAQAQQNFDEWCRYANELADTDQFKSLFANSVLIGDSIAHGVIQTDLMLESSVVAEVGANFMDLTDLLPNVQSMYPQKIFLYCGFNDIGMCHGDQEDYYYQFTAYVQNLQAACPGVPIYINHLIRCLNLDTLQNGNYANVDEYNGIIDRIAQENGLVVIDSSDLVKAEFYYKDGYHMIYPFYPLWLRRMAEVSGLM